MNREVARVLGVVSPLLTVAVCAPAGAAIMSLKAVAVNGQLLPERTNDVAIEPGDEVTVEIFLSDWGDEIERVSAFQATILGEDGSQSGESGTMLPCAWPMAHDPCLFQDVTRPDWIHAGCESGIIGPPDTGTLDVRFWSIVLECEEPFGDCEPPLDDGTERYGGTIILVASADACGTFIFNLDTAATESFLEGCGGTRIGITAEPLVVEVACSPRIVGTCPDDCAVDARYPHDPFDSGFSRRWDSVQFDIADVDAATLACSDFAVSFAGGTPILLSCFLVNDIGPNTVEVIFSNTIPTSRWTCLVLRNGLPGYDQVCLASLPGDVNADLVSNGGDILSLVESLYEGTELRPWQCDIDRDGRCTQLDLLGLVDVLVGANAFLPWYGASISVPCPSASMTAMCGDLGER